MARRRCLKRKKILRDFLTDDELWAQMQALLPGEGLRVNNDGVEKFVWNEHLLRKAYTRLFGIKEERSK